MQRREEQRRDGATQGVDRVPPSQREGKQPYAAEIEDYAGETVAPPAGEKTEKDRRRDDLPGRASAPSHRER